MRTRNNYMKCQWCELREAEFGITESTAIVEDLWTLNGNDEIYRHVKEIDVRHCGDGETLSRICRFCKENELGPPVITGLTVEDFV